MKVKDEGSDSMRMWGALLRRLRTAAGVSHEELARYVGYSKSLVVGVERGVRMPSTVFVTRADELLRAEGLLKVAAAHLSRQRFLPWTDEYSEAEGRARALLSYGTHVLHELLQTEGYARAVLGARCPVLDDSAIEARLAVLAERQELVERTPPCAMGFIVEEWVLRRAVGGYAVMREQVERLIALSSLRNVTIQVMPTAYDVHAGVDGPLTLLEMPEHKWLVYLEAHGTGQLIDEPDQVSAMHERHSMIRSQALTPRDSAAFLRRLLEEMPRTGGPRVPGSPVAPVPSPVPVRASA
jgi:transcriptional regulator with XRE-family HTH domain